jgi:hypothetical protein
MVKHTTASEYRPAFHTRVQHAVWSACRFESALVALVQQASGPSAAFQVDVLPERRVGPSRSYYVANLVPEVPQVFLVSCIGYHIKAAVWYFLTPLLCSIKKVALCAGI